MADDWRRITVDADPEAFPSMQGYIQNEEQIWWDLRFLYQAMHNSGEGRQRGDWLKRVKQLLGQDGLLDHVRIGGSDRVTNVISTKAVVFFCANSIDVTRTLQNTMLSTRLPSICDSPLHTPNHGK